MEIAGRVYSVSNSVQSYINLKPTNADLMQRIAVLEEEIQGYKKDLENFTGKMLIDSINIGINRTTYKYIPARVVYNQISETNNFIILNKGSNHGITEDMAVVSVKGIVGMVTNVSPRHSRVIPVLNSRSHLNCIIKSTRLFGSLFWDGKDSRYVHLSGLPSHASYTIGDTIVTSGYSFAFPEEVFVGVVEDAIKQKNEEYNSLKIRLFTDFSTLNEVFIIQNPLSEERMKMEKGVGEE